MKFIKIAILTLFIPVLLFAEGGSIYTRTGLGDINYAFSARRTAMGELGTALFDRDHLGAWNPASWSRLNLTRLETGINYQGFDIADNQSSAYYGFANFAGLMLGVPLQRDYGLSLAFGVVPYTNSRYDVAEDYPNDAVPHSLTYQGRGSLTKTFVGMSYTLPIGVSIGATLDYFVGNFKYLTTLGFSDESLVSSEYRRTNKLSGIGTTLGVISNDFAQLLNIRNVQDLRLGLTYTFSGEFDAEVSNSVDNYRGIKDFTVGLAPLTLSSEKTNAKLPDRLGLGASMTYDNSYIFLLDYLYQPWSKYEFNNQTDPSLRDLQKLSAGFEYRGRQGSNTFWGNVMLRGGLSYEQTQYNIKGQGINQYSVYGGFSLPLEYENSIDVALEYGMRGTKDFNLMKENIYKLSVSLSLGELWFIRRGQ